MLFLRKTDETIWNSSFLGELPPFNQPISEQFVHDPHLCPNFKTEIPPPPPPPPLNIEETMVHDRDMYSQIK